MYTIEHCLWYQVITWTNVNFSKEVLCGIHTRAISKEIILNLICNIWSDFILLNFLPLYGQSLDKYLLYASKYAYALFWLHLLYSYIFSNGCFDLLYSSVFSYGCIWTICPKYLWLIIMLFRKPNDCTVNNEVTLKEYWYDEPMDIP